MIYRRFGRTELQMPVFSCGGMRYQQKWQDIPMDEVEAANQRNLEATIRKAFDLGIHHIETARGYGSSERQLGHILPKLDRDKLIVQTKVAPTEDPATFTAQVEESLERLQLDHVDLLGLHGLNNDETIEHALRPHGCLAAARQMQKRGLVRHVGFSTHARTDQIMRCIEHETDDGFDYVNLHWYWIFQENWRAIEAATQRDMGVFIISPSDKGGMLYKPSQTFLELTKPLHPMVFNDLFCLSHEQVHTLSIGAAKPSDFDEHLNTLALLERAEEVLPPILGRLEAVRDEKLPRGLREPFALGLPNWEQTPGGVNLPMILWLLGLAKAFDMTEYAKMRYNLLGNGGHWFPGNNASELDEPALLAIAQQCGLDGELVPWLREAHVMLKGEEKKRLSEGD